MEDAVRGHTEVQEDNMHAAQEDNILLIHQASVFIIKVYRVGQA